MSFLKSVMLPGLALLVTACGGEDTHAKIMEDTYDLMEQIAAVLEDVNDEQSAEAAAAELEQIAEKFEKITERNEAIGPPDPETVESLKEEFGDRRDQLETRLNVEKLMAVTDSADGPLRRSLRDLGTVVQEMR